MFDDSESVQHEAEDGAVVKSVRKIELFDDQRDVLEEAQSHLMLGKKVLLQMPTGGGKTVMATRLVQIASRHSRVWFICHLKEIIKQTSNTFSTYGIAHGVIAGKHEQTPEANVQVASVQTLKWRSSRFGDPDIVIWDEAHHIAAKSWAALMAQFPNARHIGLTATPERLDGTGLADWFNVLVRGPSNKELIKLKRLSDFRMFVPSEPDLTNARIQAGDYHKGDIDKVMNTPVLIGDAVDHYKRLADGKRALVFATSIEASRNIVDRFVVAGVPADHVDGTTSDDDRRDIVDRLAKGELKVVSNVDVFGEGFDLPALDCVILMRPTRSLAKYLQMVGRVLRVDDGKIDTLILDHAGCYYEHGTPDIEWEWSLEGGARKRRIAKMRETGERIGRKCPQCSQVHVERVMVCDCGYEFRSGAEVGEFDGYLGEVNRGDRLMMKLQYAVSKGVSMYHLRSWMSMGMPMHGRLVPVLDADSWLAENVKLDEIINYKEQEIGDRENLSTFSKRMKVTPHVVKKWIKRGMPKVGHLIPVKDALIWIGENVDLTSTRMFSDRRKKHHGYESINAFAKRHGFSSGYGWIKKGLPITEYGVPIKDGDDWLKEFSRSNPNHNGMIRNRADGLTAKEFAERAGVGRGVPVSLIKKGMPRNSFGRLVWGDCMDWLMRQDGKVLSPKISPFWVNDPKSYEDMTAFSIRIGRRRLIWYYDRLIESGIILPANGWIHIQRGLEWVRDNTNIEIPPEAWPKKDEDGGDQND